jgi:raffinose/stachyose/melibiose transport system substrate-binding protein
MKREQAILLIAAVVMLSGCAKNSKDVQNTQAKSERTVKWMTVRSAHPIWDLIVKEYEKEHPGFKVEFESISDRGSYNQKLKILAAGNELPDMFDSEGDDMLAQIAANGVLKDIDELYKELGYDRTMNIGKNYARLSDGKLYSISWENNIEYFWYHKDLFAKAGIEKTPETFEELLTVCQKLKDAGIAPISTWGSAVWPLLRWMSFIPFRLTGNDFIENLKAGKAKMSDPVGIQAAEFFQKLGKNYFQPGWATCDYTNALQTFLSGNAAIYFIGAWQFNSFRGDDRELKEDYAYFTLPTLTGAVNGKTDMYINAGTGTSIRKDRYDAQLKDFIQYFLDKYPETYYNEGKSFPPMSFDTTKENISSFDKQVMDDCNSLTSFAYTWDVRLDTATNEVVSKEIINLGMGTITPQEFAKRIDNAIAKNIAR